MAHRVLVPVDGSQSALRAARWAAELASNTGARVTLLWVHNSGGYTELGIEALSREEADEAKVHLAAEIFAAAGESFRERGVEYEQEVAFGDPAEEICNLVARGRYDHVIMGTRGRSRFSQILMGGVAQKVLHHASCPVTIVR
ncbi:MAG: universal stress protein [Planctomycetota bacterium]